jgi:hypothetical protein
MKKITIGISIALLIFWVLGFFMLQLSGVIHAALVLSVILFLRFVLIAPAEKLQVVSRG